MHLTWITQPNSENWLFFFFKTWSHSRIRATSQCPLSRSLVGCQLSVDTKPVCISLVGFHLLAIQVKSAGWPCAFPFFGIMLFILFTSVIVFLPAFVPLDRFKHICSIWMWKPSQALESSFKPPCVAHTQQRGTANPLAFFCSQAKCSGSGRMYLVTVIIFLAWRLFFALSGCTVDAVYAQRVCFSCYCRIIQVFLWQRTKKGDTYKGNLAAVCWICRDTWGCVDYLCCALPNSGYNKLQGELNKEKVGCDVWSQPV